MPYAIRTLGKTPIAALLAVGIAVTGSASPAAAAPWWFYHRPVYQHSHHPHYYRPNYYGSYPRYYSYPRYNYYTYDPGAAVASGLIGGIFGAIAGTALGQAGVGGGHVWRCQHHYRTYQPSTNSFLGYDGHRHICRF